MTITAPARSGYDALAGRILDADSHEQIPVQLFAEYFGAVGAEAAAFRNRMGFAAADTDVVADDAEITEESAWNVKGAAAPSAVDLRRRTQVLDVMGIDRQLVFPSFALLGLHYVMNPKAAEFLGFDPDTTVDVHGLGRRIIAAYNDWAVESTRISPRLRPVAVVLTDSIEQMMHDAEELIGRGVRAVWLPAGVPPADRSPADRDLDPFWALLAETGTVATVHVGTEFALFASTKWGSNVPEFVANRNQSIEFTADPYHAAIAHYCAENYVQILCLGGVFERHPNLRFGAIEVEAHWVGPLADKMDTIAEEMPSRLGSLSMRPSEYLKRNVRATPFYFEHLDRYIERWPELLDVFAYGSDFPHREGGKDSARQIHGRIARLGDDVVEKVFVTNAEWLLPA